MRTEKPLQGRAVYATEEGRRKLLKVLQFYDLVAGRDPCETLPVEDPQVLAVANVLEQLARVVPPQYILGRAVFMDNTFYCTSDTLIPRPETGVLVQTACDYLEEKKRNGSPAQTVIEIGTGCGNIAVSLAMRCDEGVRILASDISPAAVEVARRNVQKHQVDGRVSLFCGDLYEPFRTPGHRGYGSLQPTLHPDDVSEKAGPSNHRSRTGYRSRRRALRSGHIQKAFERGAGIPQKGWCIGV